MHPSFLIHVCLSDACLTQADVLPLVMAALARSATSPADVASAALSCRAMRDASQDPAVLASLGPAAMACPADRFSDSYHVFLSRCSEAGNAEAAYMQGMIEFYCLKNRRDGIRSLVKAAKAGHADALYSLAVVHFNGSGSAVRERKLTIGVLLCASAAQMGNIEALRELGHCFQDGYGIRRNAAEGKRLLMEANLRELLAQQKTNPSVTAVSSAAPHPVALPASPHRLLHQPCQHQQQHQEQEREERCSHDHHSGHQQGAHSCHHHQQHCHQSHHAQQCRRQWQNESQRSCQQGLVQQNSGSQQCQSGQRQSQLQRQRQQTKQSLLPLRDHFRRELTPLSAGEAQSSSESSSDSHNPTERHSHSDTVSANGAEHAHVGTLQQHQDEQAHVHVQSQLQSQSPLHLRSQHQCPTQSQWQQLAVLLQELHSHLSRSLQLLSQRRSDPQLHLSQGHCQSQTEHQLYIGNQSQPSLQSQDSLQSQQSLQSQASTSSSIPTIPAHAIGQTAADPLALLQSMCHCLQPLLSNLGCPSANPTGTPSPPSPSPVQAFLIQWNAIHGNGTPQESTLQVGASSLAQEGLSQGLGPVPTGSAPVGGITVAPGVVQGSLLKVCASAVCGRVETRVREFRCCSVCSGPSYCSRACQASDWKAGHMDACTGPRP